MIRTIVFAALALAWTGAAVAQTPADSPAPNAAVLAPAVAPPGPLVTSGSGRRYSRHGTILTTGSGRVVSIGSGRRGGPALDPAGAAAPAARGK